MENKTVNHWGKWVSSDTPVTGVISNNEITWEWIDNEICLTCEEITEEINNDDSIPDDEKQSELDFMECSSDHTRLLGDWIYDTKTKQYGIDKNGEFSAIEREDVTQIVWSKFIKHNCALCSPCYPGQVDLDSKGDFIGYSLPDYLLPEGYNEEFTHDSQN